MAIITGIEASIIYALRNKQAVSLTKNADNPVHSFYFSVRQAVEEVIAVVIMLRGINWCDDDNDDDGYCYYTLLATNEQ